MHPARCTLHAEALKKAKKIIEAYPHCLALGQMQLVAVELGANPLSCSVFPFVEQNS
jgi:ABC-type microcin C transport system duplicated ATPase subunit YejF